MTRTCTYNVGDRWSPERACGRPATVTLIERGRHIADLCIRHESAARRCAESLAATGAAVPRFQPLESRT